MTLLFCNRYSVVANLFKLNDLKNIYTMRIRHCFYFIKKANLSECALSLPLPTERAGERSSMTAACDLSRYRSPLHAQERTLPLIIEV